MQYKEITKHHIVAIQSHSNQTYFPTCQYRVYWIFWAKLVYHMLSRLVRGCAISWPMGIPPAVLWVFIPLKIMFTSHWSFSRSLLNFFVNHIELYIIFLRLFRACTTLRPLGVPPAVFWVLIALNFFFCPPLVFPAKIGVLREDAPLAQKGRVNTIGLNCCHLRWSTVLHAQLRTTAKVWKMIWQHRAGGRGKSGLVMAARRDLSWTGLPAVLTMLHPQHKVSEIEPTHERFQRIRRRT